MLSVHPAVALLCVVISGQWSLVSSACPAGATETVGTVIGGFCYEFVDKETNWYNAVAGCEAKGGRLLEIPSAEVQDFVDVNLIAFRQNQELGIWIGAKRATNADSTGGAWFWHKSNTKLSYENWAQDEPSMFWNSYYDPEECAYMRYDKSWQWNDFPCTDTYWGSHSYICEYVGEGSLDTSGGIYHGGSNVTEMALTMEPTTTTTTPEVYDGSAGRSGSDDRAQSDSTVAPLLPHLTHFFSVAGFTIASILLVAVLILFGVYIVRKWRQAKTGDNQNTPLFHKSQPKQSVPISDYGSPIFL